MQIHTDRLSFVDIFRFAKQMREHGYDVHIEDPEGHGSRSRARRLDFRMTGTSNARPNFWNGCEDEYAATWDEWGILFGMIFEADPDAHCGRYGYKSGEDFHRITAGRFEEFYPEDEHRAKRHNWVHQGGGWMMCNREGCTAEWRR